MLFRSDRVKLGAHLASGTTVMHEGFVNFNAGTLGASFKFSGGRSLAQQQVQAIVNLVSTSVEGLGPEHITVADSRGKVLYELRSDTDMASMTSTQLEYQMNMQRQLEQRVEQLLTPIVGPGKATFSAAVRLERRL